MTALPDNALSGGDRLRGRATDLSPRELEGAPTLTGRASRLPEADVRQSRTT